MTIATFGEIMMRLGAQNNNRLIQSKSVDLSFAGSEANVAVDLAYWGMNTRFLTSIPENTLGEMVSLDLRQYEVDTNYFRRTPNGRLGLLFLEHGANQRSSKVVYDRIPSAFCTEELDEPYFKNALLGCTWFHWSGITPGINEICVSNLKTALKVAHEYKIKISCDLNYRSKLWNYGKQAYEIMPELLIETDVILGNEEDAIIMLGIENSGIDIKNGELENESYINVCNSIFKQFPKCETICISKRESLSADNNNWSAMLARRDLFLESSTYKIKNIIDRVGAGDSFSAGIIYGVKHFENDYRKILEFATAASCIKHSIRGDYCLSGTNEIMDLVKGNSFGRIIR